MMIYTEEQLEIIRRKLSKTSGTFGKGQERGIKIDGYILQVDCHWFNSENLPHSLEIYLKNKYQKNILRIRLQSKTKAILVFPLYDSEDNLTDIFWLSRLSDHRAPYPSIKYWL